MREVASPSRSNQLTTVTRDCWSFFSRAGTAKAILFPNSSRPGRLNSGRRFSVLSRGFFTNLTSVTAKR